MKPIPLALALVGLIAAPASGAVTEDEWFNESLSADQRNQLVERSKKEPFDVIAPIVLKAQTKYQPIYGMNPFGETPWNDYARNPRDAIYLMAQSVWWHHLSATRDDPFVSKTVLSLLKQSSSAGDKLYYIGAMRVHQWCPEAEPVLGELCRDVNQPLVMRTRSAEVLLQRCDPNTHIRQAVEIVLAHKPGSDRCRAFNETMNFGNRFKQLGEGNKRVLLAAGFEIIEELPESELRTGYFVATSLAGFLERDDRFMPDRTQARYRGHTGLTREFFIDTVKNAIAWHAMHPEATKVD